MTDKLRGRGYSLADSSVIVGVSTRTLARWIEEDGVQLPTDPTDQRKKILTLGQLREVATKHGYQIAERARTSGPLASPAGAPAGDRATDRAAQPPRPAWSDASKRPTSPPLAFPPPYTGAHQQASRDDAHAAVELVQAAMTRMARPLGLRIVGSNLRRTLSASDATATIWAFTHVARELAGALQRVINDFDLSESNDERTSERAVERARELVGHALRTLQPNNALVRASQSPVPMAPIVEVYHYYSLASRLANDLLRLMPNAEHDGHASSPLRD
jgi:hypothetical protein